MSFDENKAIGPVVTELVKKEEIKSLFNVNSIKKELGEFEHWRAPKDVFFATLLANVSQTCLPWPKHILGLKGKWVLYFVTS